MKVKNNKMEYIEKLMIISDWGLIRVQLTLMSTKEI